MTRSHGAECQRVESYRERENALELFRVPLHLCVCVCVCVLVSLTQSCLTLCDTMDCSIPGSSVLGVLQATILEWLAVLSRTEPVSPKLQADSLPSEPPGKPALKSLAEY